MALELGKILKGRSNKLTDGRAQCRAEAIAALAAVNIIRETDYHDVAVAVPEYRASGIEDYDLFVVGIRAQNHLKGLRDDHANSMCWQIEKALDAVHSRQEHWSIGGASETTNGIIYFKRCKRTCVLHDPWTGFARPSPVSPETKFPRGFDGLSLGAYERSPNPVSGIVVKELGEAALPDFRSQGEQKGADCSTPERADFVADHIRRIRQESPEFRKLEEFLIPRPQMALLVADDRPSYTPSWDCYVRNALLFHGTFGFGETKLPSKAAFFSMSGMAPFRLYAGFNWFGLEGFHRWLDTSVRAIDSILAEEDYLRTRK